MPPAAPVALNDLTAGKSHRIFEPHVDPHGLARRNQRIRDWTLHSEAHEPAIGGARHCGVQDTAFDAASGTLDPQAPKTWHGDADQVHLDRLVQRERLAAFTLRLETRRPGPTTGLESLPPGAVGEIERRQRVLRNPATELGGPRSNLGLDLVPGIDLVKDRE